MKALQIAKGRTKVSDSSFAEMSVWELPRKLPGSDHLYKYRLAFVVSGRCVIRYDNESGKGDHKHLGGKERHYTFETLEKLNSDFWSDVEVWRLKNDREHEHS